MKYYHGEFHLLRLPVQIRRQIIHHACRVQRTESRELGYAAIEVDVALFHELALRSAVGAVADALVDEDAVCPGDGGAEGPLIGVGGDRAEEEDNLERTPDLELLDADACGPVEISVGGAFA